MFHHFSIENDNQDNFYFSLSQQFLMYCIPFRCPLSDDQKYTIRTSDNFTVVDVSESVCCMSTTLKNMIDSGMVKKNTENNALEIPVTVSKETMDKVIKWMKYHLNNPPKPTKTKIPKLRDDSYSF